MSDNDSLIVSIKSRRIEVVRLLLSDPQVDPADQNNRAIILAAGCGHTEIVSLLLQDRRVNPADQNNCAIRVAAAEGYTEVVRLLLCDPRVDPGADDDYAIRWAAAEGNTGVVRLLLQDSRVNPANNRGLNRIGQDFIEAEIGRDALTLAAIEKYTGIVKLLYLSSSDLRLKQSPIYDYSRFLNDFNALPELVCDVEDFYSIPQYILCNIINIYDYKDDRTSDGRSEIKFEFENKYNEYCQKKRHKRRRMNGKCSKCGKPK